MYLSSPRPSFFVPQGYSQSAREENTLYLTALMARLQLGPQSQATRRIGQQMRESKKRLVSPRDHDLRTFLSLGMALNAHWVRVPGAGLLAGR